MDLAGEMRALRRVVENVGKHISALMDMSRAYGQAKAALEGRIDTLANRVADLESAVWPVQPPRKEGE